MANTATASAAESHLIEDQAAAHDHHLRRLHSLKSHYEGIRCANQPTQATTAATGGGGGGGGGRDETLTEEKENMIVRISLNKKDGGSGGGGGGGAGSNQIIK